MTPVWDPKQCFVENNLRKPERISWGRNYGGWGMADMEQKSWKGNRGWGTWRRNHGGGIMEEESWRWNHWGGSMEEESWMSNHYREMLEVESLRGDPGGEIHWGGIADEESSRRHPRKHTGVPQETLMRHSGGAQDATQGAPWEDPGHPRLQKGLRHKNSISQGVFEGRCHQVL